MSQALLDAVGSAFGPATATSLTYTGLTVTAAANRVLVLSIGWISDPGTITVMRWDNGGTNQDLALIKRITGSNGQVSALYGVVAPTAGNKTLQVNWTNSIEHGCAAISFKNASQAGGALSFPNAMASIVTGTTAGIAIPLPAGCGVSCAAGGISFGVSSAAPTQLYVIHGTGTFESAGAYSDTGNGNFTTTWAGAEPNWSMVATAIGELLGSTAPWVDQRTPQTGPPLQQRMG